MKHALVNFEGGNHPVADDLSSADDVDDLADMLVRQGIDLSEKVGCLHSAIGSSNPTLSPGGG